MPHDPKDELNDLVYAVSHDVRQPLRTILHCLQFMERRHADELSPEALDLLNRALDATNTGTSMIDDLLVYSRLTTQAKPHESVDLQATIERAIREVGDADAITTDNLPTVHGEPKQIRLLFGHLLRNCLTFSAPDRPLSVQVISSIEGTRATFSIADNGIGFDPTMAERILKPFQKLAPRGDTPSNGMGLAIAQKIVFLHGGDLRITSPGVDEGATVTFSLPLATSEAKPRVNIRRA